MRKGRKRKQRQTVQAGQQTASEMRPLARGPGSGPSLVFAGVKRATSAGGSRLHARMCLGADAQDSLRHALVSDNARSELFLLTSQTFVLKGSSMSGPTGVAKEASRNTRV